MKGGTSNKFIFVAENMESQTKSNFHKSVKSKKSQGSGKKKDEDEDSDTSKESRATPVAKRCPTVLFFDDPTVIDQVKVALS